MKLFAFNVTFAVAARDLPGAIKKIRPVIRNRPDIVAVPKRGEIAQLVVIENGAGIGRYREDRNAAEIVRGAGK